MLSSHSIRGLNKKGGFCFGRRQVPDTFSHVNPGTASSWEGKVDQLGKILQKTPMGNPRRPIDSSPAVQEEARQDKEKT